MINQATPTCAARGFVAIGQLPAHGLDGDGVGVAWYQLQEVQGGDMFGDRARLNESALLR